MAKVWIPEKHGGDPGWRLSDGSAYVGRSPKKHWRLWVRGEDGTFIQSADIFDNPDEAKAMVS